MKEKKRIKICMIIILISLIVLIPTINSTNDNIDKINKNNDVKYFVKNGNILYVGGKGFNNYSEIRDAIHDANNGDTIFVYNGIYNEILYIDKTISLIGENKHNTIIDIEERGSIIISIKSNNVNISRFTIRNGSWRANLDIIMRITGNNSSIIGNIFQSNRNGEGIGIYLEKSKNNTIKDNTFENNGLYLSESSDNDVSNNILNNKQLFYLEEKKNIIIDKEKGQIILVNCENITILNQDVSHCSIAIQLLGTNNSTIKNNKIGFQQHYGIELANSNNNVIEKNNITDGGFYFIGSNCNRVDENLIGGKGFLIYNSKSNIISNNSINNLYIETNERGFYSSYNWIDSNLIYGDIQIENSNKTIINNNKIEDDFILINSNYTEINKNTIREGRLTLYNSNNCKICLNKILTQGIRLTKSPNNQIVSNIISHSINIQENCDIKLYESNNSILINNSLKKGLLIEKSTNNIICGNKVNNKTIHYLENIKDKTIKGETGQIILFDCKNITIQNKTIKNTIIGLYLLNTKNCTISNNDISHNINEGLILINSSLNSINNNTIVNNNKNSYYYSNNPAGLYIYKSNNNAIKNNIINENKNGIIIRNSNENTILNNEIINNKNLGLKIYSSNNSIIKNNILINNQIGIELSQSRNNIITDNLLTNKKHGLYLISSIKSKINNNQFFQTGLYLSGSYNNEISNNTINNEEIKYLENHTRKKIDKKFGQIIIVNCSKIMVKNQIFYNTTYPMQIINSEKCQIINNTFNKIVEQCIRLIKSVDNSISQNKIINSNYGIYLHYSNSNNNISQNSIINNQSGVGIFLNLYNDNNSINQNNISKSSIGIHIQHSKNNDISHNILIKNQKSIYIRYSSDNNTISYNLIRENIEGLQISDSSYNTIDKNNFIDNERDAFFTSIVYYDQKWRLYNKFKNNYWGKPKILPKPIFGKITVIIHNHFGGSRTFPWMNLDRYPAIKPHTIYEDIKENYTKIKIENNLDWPWWEGFVWGRIINPRIEELPWYGKVIHCYSRVIHYIAYDFGFTSGLALDSIRYNEIIIPYEGFNGIINNRKILGYFSSNWLPKKYQ
jgi:parallel beta-helix repeat protein